MPFKRYRRLGRKPLTACAVPEKDAANAAKDAEAARSKLQAALDQAHAEIEPLKTELRHEEALPPQEGDSASQPPV
jgi:hypothetical protein